jgi:hypothetical protein
MKYIVISTISFSGCLAGDMLAYSEILSHTMTMYILFLCAANRECVPGACVMCELSNTCATHMC